MRAIFCDETGDPGWRLQDGASPLFVVCALACHDSSEVSRILQRQDDFCRDFKWSGELKWAKMRPEMRLEFMVRMIGVLPAHRAILWRKSGKPIAFGVSPEAELLRRCVLGLTTQFQDVRLVVDGERNHRRAAALRAAIGVGEVRFEQSHRSPCLQLADMLVGFHASCAKHKMLALPKQLLPLRTCLSEWT